MSAPWWCRVLRPIHYRKETVMPTSSTSAQAPIPQDSLPPWTAAAVLVAFALFLAGFMSLHQLLDAALPATSVAVQGDAAVPVIAAPAMAAPSDDSAIEEPAPTF
jgi:hypothetical protein